MMRVSRHWHRRVLFFIEPRLYTRWLRWRFIRSFHKTQRELGLRLLPALETTALQMQEWLRVTSTTTNAERSSDFFDFLPPGSFEARGEGCVCPAADNNYGEGYVPTEPVPDASLFVVSTSCLFHGGGVTVLCDHRWVLLPTMDTNPPTETRQCSRCEVVESREGVGYRADGSRIEATAWSVSTTDELGEKE